MANVIDRQPKLRFHGTLDAESTDIWQGSELKGSIVFCPDGSEEVRLGEGDAEVVIAMDALYQVVDRSREAAARRAQAS